MGRRSVNLASIIGKGLKRNTINIYLNRMMPFSVEIGLERVGVVGPDLDCWWTGL